MHMLMVKIVRTFGERNLKWTCWPTQPISAPQTATSLSYSNSRYFAFLSSLIKPISSPNILLGRNCVFDIYSKHLLSILLCLSNDFFILMWIFYSMQVLAWFHYNGSKIKFDTNKPASTTISINIFFFIRSNPLNILIMHAWNWCIVIVWRILML